jgi:hypothetical protein
MASCLCAIGKCPTRTHWGSATMDSPALDINTLLSARVSSSRFISQSSSPTTSILQEMATTTTTTLLPMWRSPTASSCSSRTPNALRLQDSWDDDEAYALGAKSPARIVQCLNFLSQVDRIQVREIHHKRFREPVFQLDVFLCDDDDGSLCDYRSTTSQSQQQATYQIERTLAEFEQLRDDVLLWATQDATRCSYCAGFQTQAKAWEQYWPRTRLLRRLLGLSKVPSDHLLETMLDDVVALARSQLRYAGEPCEALRHVPVLATSFLVRHELSMDE